MTVPPDHWRFFREFAHGELRAGGPDPQLALVGLLSRDVLLAERIWRAGCYIAVYNVPFAEFIWREWPWARMLKEPGDLRAWLEDNWRKIVTRVERRCVRHPAWMTTFLIGYATWAESLPDLLTRWLPYTPTERYDRLWECALSVPRLGRYVALKLLEFLRTECGVAAEPPDIRPRGGWSPREALNLLYPDALIAADDDRPAILRATNERVAATQARLRELGCSVSLFQLQVLLCEYRECYEGQRQYPGRSLDSELGYAAKATQRQCDGVPTAAFWQARQTLCSPWHLGELQGWSGPRRILGTVLRHHGYVWSDLDYCYRETCLWAHPVRRTECTCA